MPKFEEQFKEISGRLIATEKKLQSAEAQRQNLETKLGFLEGIGKSFNLRDIIQQIVGALLVSVPMTWVASLGDFTAKISWLRILIILAVFLILSMVLTYYNKFYEVKSRKIIGIPLRCVSLIIVTLGINLIVFYLYNVPNNSAGDWDWIIKHFLFIFSFSTLGAATSDFIK